MFRLQSAAIAVAWFAGSGSAWACSDAGALLKDDFDSIQTKTWNIEGKPSINEGRLAMRPNAGSTSTIYSVKTFADVDICVDVAVMESPDLAGSYTGIAFWVADFANLYVFQITPDGYAGAFRLRKDNWSDVVKDEETEAVEQGIVSVNELRVVTSGKTARLYINGHQFKEITGTPPAGGQHVGYTVESPDRGRATFELDDLVVLPKRD